MSTKKKEFKRKPAERLAHLIENLGLTQEQFAESLGYKRGHINNVLNGRKELSSALACCIRERFGVSLDWLLKGDGQMFPVWEVEPTPTTTLTPDLAEVQRIQVTVPCAAVGVFETLADALRDGTAPQEQRAIPLSVVSAPENVRCFPLDTDEMAPLLPRGTVVALDKGRRREDLDGKIIAARTAEGDLRVLRLKIIHHGRWGEFPQLVPENPACQDTSNPILLEDSGTAIIGQIVWAWLDLRNPPK